VSPISIVLSPSVRNRSMSDCLVVIRGVPKSLQHNGRASSPRHSPLLRHFGHVR